MPERFDRESYGTVFTIDISSGWDTESQAEIFKSKLHQLPFYRPGLLYSGFNGLSGKKEGAVFCASEKNIGVGESAGKEDPLMFALGEEKPAIAVYDPALMKSLTSRARLNEYKYKVLSPAALIATIILK